MRKIFSWFFLFFCLFWSVFAQSDIKIISREEWWADESYRFLDSKEWEEIFKKRKAEAEKEKNFTEEQILKQKENAEKRIQILEKLNNEFWKYRKTNVIQSEENGRKLARPIELSENITWIVVHHTASNYEDSYDGIRRIYKFHALWREWGDIWYNYIIWKDWEIFEWRSGGERSVAAHDLWNNKWNIWISLIWDFSIEWPREEQREALKKLTKYLVKKYDIDLNQKKYFHKVCVETNCEHPLDSFQEYPIIWHRDAGHTSCPGEELYHQLQLIKSELRSELWFVQYSKKGLEKKFDKQSKKSLFELLLQLEEVAEKKPNVMIDDIIFQLTSYLKKSTESVKKHENIHSFAKEYIKVKLSYPHENFIEIKSWNEIFQINRQWKWISINGWPVQKAVRISWKWKKYLEISSWSRTPSWDKNKKYNDNKFRGDIVIYIKNNQLVVVNQLRIHDYLKGLWEVSNGAQKEKAKTIIIAARSYAYWYMTQDRKFKNEWYDASDDPDVFQKYLWYWLENRSPKINAIVDETKDLVILYNKELIKPWYSSRTNGKTRSFKSYCVSNKNDMKTCNRLEKSYPYLQSVNDPASRGETRLWHWVWISGKWADHFAEHGWSAEMIIEYYLQGTNIGYLEKNFPN